MAWDCFKLGNGLCWGKIKMTGKGNVYQNPDETIPALFTFHQALEKVQSIVSQTLCEIGN